MIFHEKLYIFSLFGHFLIKISRNFLGISHNAEEILKMNAFHGLIDFPDFFPFSALQGCPEKRENSRKNLSHSTTVPRDIVSFLSAFVVVPQQNSVKFAAKNHRFAEKSAF